MRIAKDMYYLVHVLSVANVAVDNKKPATREGGWKNQE